jgi:hypothetical protein
LALPFRLVPKVIFIALVDALAFAIILELLDFVSDFINQINNR